jgi:putative colanic acid biosynthesis UDP-glucose lipid carrier transferase
MAEHLVFKNNFSLAMASMRSMLPAAAAVGCLFVVAQAYGVEFSRDFAALSIIVAALSAVLLRPPQMMTNGTAAQWGGLAVGVVTRWLVILAVLLAIGYATKFSSLYSRRVVITWALVTPLVLIAVTLALHAAMRRVLSDPANSRRVIFAGYNDISCSLAERLSKDGAAAMTVAGFFDDRSAERLGALGGLPLLGRLPSLPEYVKTHGIDVIFVAIPIRHIRRVLDLIEELRDTTASIYYIPDIFVFDLIQARTLDILGIPVIAMCETPFSGYRGVFKRLTDVVMCLAMLPLLLPVMLVIGIAVKVSSGGSMIFRQRRYGLDGREITIYKFRTMTVTEDGSRVTQATRDDARITPVGRILRRYSLDELPQLFNVLQGRMSLVGPRPHAVAHNEEYRKLIKGYMVRHKVPPGITGLAQINGCRGETAELGQMQARVNYDLEYLRHWSPLLDCKILLLTVFQMVRSDKAAY